jgi:predicted nucleotidyltransferase
VPELDIRGILVELSREGVEFLVIGGVAVGFHGYVRATKDVDIVPAPDPANLMQWIDETALWDKLAPAAVEAEIDGLAIKFASYDDLVALKEMAGRPEDLIDLQRLRQARGEE